ncbi:protein max-like [Sycon ciliatum]|uniref:protein max-like n=1 Tax=Sycon ciliatum TaxID=27933 RepID=UPI0020ABEA8D|eukprot:scpid93104/ scgid31751/ Protein max; Myc-associated factor X
MYGSNQSEDNEQYLSTEEDDVDGDGDSKLPGDKKARAHHNYLERLRRDHIKESFKTLKQSLPSMGNERASRASILNSATGYINQLKKSNGARAAENDQIRRENELLERQLREAGMPVPGGLALHASSISLRRPMATAPHIPVTTAHMPTTAHFSVPLEHQLGAAPLPQFPATSVPAAAPPPGASTLQTSAVAASTPTSSHSSHSPLSQDSDDSEEAIEPQAKRQRPARRKVQSQQATTSAAS